MIPAIDLSIFDIDFDPAATIPDAGEVAAIVCGKCHGRGKFVSYTGRVVGKCFACGGTGVKAQARGAEPAGAAIDVSAITVSFEAARANGIKTPKLRLADFIFSRAPDTGANAGSIYVKRSRAAGGDYLGKVTAGRFMPSRDCDGPTGEAIVAVASDPHNAAKAYGMRTGSCSCCGRELTNGLSIDLGIGPICRGKFGWGG
jgi:hypothetical protein